jgi:hypothetical protein
VLDGEAMGLEVLMRVMKEGNQCRLWRHTLGQFRKLRMMMQQLMTASEQGSHVLAVNMATHGKDFELGVRQM